MASRKVLQSAFPAAMALAQTPALLGGLASRLPAPCLLEILAGCDLRALSRLQVASSASQAPALDAQLHLHCLALQIQREPAREPRVCEAALGFPLELELMPRPGSEQPAIHWRRYAASSRSHPSKWLPVVPPSRRKAPPPLAVWPKIDRPAWPVKSAWGPHVEVDVPPEFRARPSTLYVGGNEIFGSVQQLVVQQPLQRLAGTPDARHVAYIEALVCGPVGLGLVDETDYELWTRFGSNDATMSDRIDSLGYCSDGSLSVRHCGKSEKFDFGPPFGICPDVIGVGVDFDQHVALFTRNGELVRTAQLPCMRDRLFAMALREGARAALVSASFDGHFLFDLEAYRRAPAPDASAAWTER